METDKFKAILDSISDDDFRAFLDEVSAVAAGSPELSDYVNFLKGVDSQFVTTGQNDYASEEYAVSICYDLAA